MTQSLERRLSRLEEKHGKDSPNLQWLRDQISASKTGETAQQKYVLGMIKRQADTTDQ
tara:strand:- start:1269 stop:1442 length:174 start_codon:yes stop_codon:yes gene_type:complete